MSKATELLEKMNVEKLDEKSVNLKDMKKAEMMMKDLIKMGKMWKDGLFGKGKSGGLANSYLSDATEAMKSLKDLIKELS